MLSGNNVWRKEKTGNGVVETIGASSREEPVLLR